ncbi:Uncharacterized protein FWK35_00022949 [Aphis craccivora]|uniref:Secreted protein n=1 Tax=Aphis craccivora TaxID=307492 RepID=A0A6G0Y1X6_APHCR|nr:Uncharacterized protein FWK35_00022949 [Aphis craccivora]
MWNASRFCVSSLRRGHANLLCIVPILVYVLPKQVHSFQCQMPYIYNSMLYKRDIGELILFFRNITIELWNKIKTPIDGASFCCYALVPRTTALDRMVAQRVIIL